MQRAIAQSTLEELIEALADAEHKRWSHWQRYLHSKCERQTDGSLLIPADLAARWQRQMDTDYSNLSEAERKSDRDQVRLYLPIVLDALNVVADDPPVESQRDK
ncbi:hypothetical protein JQ594_00785 [Bradyrhizobium manausense]|uniref:hypothetical protein n=1 Tax=Bradyrhizobium manausense TaxID=989370 RepID=UPI001BA5B307|nr:hypothetical protein [Bradyrhizobium manausense]MBR0684435.1 hypothetical protein [Bradyrhizobium manausense]